MSQVEASLLDLKMCCSSNIANNLTARHIAKPRITIGLIRPSGSNGLRSKDPNEHPLLVSLVPYRSLSPPWQTWYPMHLPSVS